MSTNRSDLLGNYDIKKLLIKLSIPATAGMIVNALYNLVDTFFVAMGAGEIAIGALAFAFPIQMIVMAIGLMIGIGSASVFSRAFGRGDKEKMSNVVNTAVRIDAFMAITVAVVGFIFIDELLTFFGATPSNIGYAKDYLSVIFIGLAPLSLSMVLNNLMRAEGRVKVAMTAMMIGAGLNILIDPIFIFSEFSLFGLTIPLLGLGVKGAAMATVLSQIVAFLFIFSKTFTADSQVRINLKGWLDVHLETVKDILVIGFPTFLRNSLGAFLAIIILKLIEYYTIGDSAIYVSVYAVINKMTFFIFMPGFGIVQGLSPIVGFNFGAKNYERMRTVILYATKIVVVYFIGGFIFVQLFSEQIFTLFSNEDTPFFIEYGAQTFRIISIGFMLVGFQIIAGAIYQAFGYPVRATLISISRQFLIFVPVAFILTKLYGLIGIWYTFAVSDILSGLIGLAMIAYEVKVLCKLIDKEKTTS